MDKPTERGETEMERAEVIRLNKWQHLVLHEQDVLHPMAVAEGPATVVVIKEETADDTADSKQQPCKNPYFKVAGDNGLYEVKEVREVWSVEETNVLLNQGWDLQAVGNRFNTTFYVLVRR